MNFPRLSRRNLLGSGFLGSILGFASTATGMGSSSALASTSSHSNALHDKHAMGAMMTVGEVDHARNGFDPHAMLTDWDRGTTSVGEDGRVTREFEVTAEDKEIEIAPGIFFPAWTYNGRVPGPTLRATEGERLRIDGADAVVKAEHNPCANIANALLFTSPESAARRQIEQIRSHNPSVVIGLDFPFWFLYGNIATEEERAAHAADSTKRIELDGALVIPGFIEGHGHFLGIGGMKTQLDLTGAASSQQHQVKAVFYVFEAIFYGNARHALGPVRKKVRNNSGKACKSKGL